MSGSLNKVLLIGHLGNDPEARSFQNGGRVVNFRLATSETWKDKQSGEKRERTEWSSVAIFNDGLCEIATRYLRKGSKVYLEGKLQTRKWQDQSGADRYSTEVVLNGFDARLILLDGPNGQTGQQNNAAGQSGGGGGGDFSGGFGGGFPGDDLDDDVPFMHFADLPPRRVL